MTEIEKSIVAGKLDDLKPKAEEGYDGIFLGQDLAKQLGVGVGDTITVLTPQGTLNPFTGMTPRSRTLRVAASSASACTRSTTPWASSRSKSPSG